RIELGDHIDVLFDTYCMEGARSRVAARLLESLAGLPHDEQRNQEYGFLERETRQQLRKLHGQGRFRYLRRGREWLALGTAATAATVDIRKDSVRNLFGFQIGCDNLKVRITIAKQTIEET